MNPGLPYPLGATLTPAGVNFALAAPNATAVELCLFERSGVHEQQRIKLSAQTDGVWHGQLPSARAGLVYGYRVHGPWAPSQGHRFNPSKVLLDPYARDVLGRYDGQALFAGHDAADPTKADRRDNAAIALKARVTAPLPAAPPGRARRTPNERVLYEAHVGALTRLHPSVPEALRGSYAGLAHASVLDHIERLGVTTVSLMPVQHRADEERLLGLGLVNHWGYNTIGWFAPEQRYWSGQVGTTPASEFRAMADAIHARGMELVIDVVYNHSAETDEKGPTLSMRGIDNALYYQLRPDDRALYENWTGTGNCLKLEEPRVLLIAEPWDIGPDGYRLGGFPPGWLEWNDKYRDTLRGFWLRQGREGAAGLGAFAHRFTASSEQFRHDARAPTASVNFVTVHDGFNLRDLVSYEQRHNEANGEHNRDGHGDNLSNNCGVEGPSDDPAVRAQRQRLQRVLLATLLMSQGTPMLLAGDEVGNGQQGNNNAYCQDNPITWLDWAGADPTLAQFVARLAALRRAAPALRNARWWPEGAGEATGIHWLRPDGQPMAGTDWHDRTAIAIVFDAVAGSGSGAWLLLVNAGAQAIDFQLPSGEWQLCLSTDPAHDPQDGAAAELARSVRVAGSSLSIART